MTSPYASGGGGPLFEVSVVAYYLAALICELPARGVLGDVLTNVRSQRANLGAPLDDIVLAGASSDGQVTALHLQVKNKVSFSAGDAEWIDVLQRAWDTFASDDFDAAHMRFGVAIGRYSARADDQYQSVLSWARYSESADDFFHRIEKKDFSSETKMAFVKAMRDTLDGRAGRPIANTELWDFLKCLVILHFDFQNGESSRDGEAVRDRLRLLFSAEPTTNAGRLWEHIITQSGRLVPAAGSFDRSGLRQRMRADGFVLVETSVSRRHALQAINHESLRALAEIKSDIAGLRLHRREASLAIRKALDDARFVQIIGEPGTGKSALLKEFADECSHVGPVFVLKDARIQPRGWATQAHILGISGSIADILTDLAGAGEPLLFIDGIDKIADPAVQITVNDILRTIAATSSLFAWKVLVTVREQNLRHLETWIDGEVLKALPIASVTVTRLGPDERDTIGAYFPQLRSLLAQTNIDVILHRPFFINALLVLHARSGVDAELPATEVALLRLWWSFGGADQTTPAAAQEQRETLIKLAETLAQAPDTALPLTGLSVGAIERLTTAGILRDVDLGHSVVFAHDIYEEWAFCEMLIRRRPAIAEFLHEVGEPQHLIRPLQLLGTYLLETESTTEAWQGLIAETALPVLRSVWQRAVLLSCLQSTRSTALLNGLSTYLLADDAQVLRKLLLALRTVEVVPNTLFLNEALTPDIDPANRPKYANLMAKPRITVWVRFLDWLMRGIERLPPAIIPDLLPVFSAWQELCAGRNVRHCDEIGRLAGEWLVQVEADMHPDNFADRRNPLGLNLPYEKEEELEKSLRVIFLGSAAENPELVTAYLEDKVQEERSRRSCREAIMESAVPLARYVPMALVNFMLATFLDEPTDAGGDPFYSQARSLIDDLGIKSDEDFSPASPLQPPFLMLLRLQEREGLRLIHAFCNHSIAFWRWSRNHPAHYMPGTPLPTVVSWDGKPREFWGDHQVYLWFRGTWGSHAVRSALMALELWALQKLDAGEPFAEIFDKVIDGNESVAILGLAVSLCLAFPQASLVQSAPLISCPHLWGWDIARRMNDRSNVNQWGDWRRHKHLLSANKTLNERPHRQRDIRELLHYLVIGGNDVLRQHVLAAISDFPKYLPFEYAEEKGNPDRVTDLTGKMSGFAELGDLKNWRMQQSRDGDGYVIWCDAPSTHTEDFKTQSEDFGRLTEYLALGLWAQKTLENGALDYQIEFADAWLRARTVEEEAAHDAQEDDFRAKQRATAIAGVAFVLARYSEDEAACAWALATLNHAATAPEVPEEYSIRSSHLSMHPKVFAVHGYSAFLARDRHVALAQNALILAALHPLEGIAEAVFVGMSAYKSKYRVFCWVLINLGIGRSIVPRDQIPNHHNIIPDAQERASNAALLRKAQQYLARGAIPHLPTIPMPWVNEPFFSLASARRWVRRLRSVSAPAPPRGRRHLPEVHGYRRNPRVFLWDVAAKLILKAPLMAIIVEDSDAQRVTELACQLRDLTIMEIMPPFARSRRDYDGNRPFEWVFACSAWLGKVLAIVPTAEAKDRILTPILSTDNKTALLMLHSVIYQFMRQALLAPPEIAQADLALWQRLADWILVNPEGQDVFDDHLDREYSECVFSLLFCAPTLSELLCSVDPGWPNLPLFSTIVGRVAVQLGANSYVFRALTTLLNRGGRDWLPEPGLGWIESIASKRKSDVQFWTIHGENTVAILKVLIATHEAELTQALRERIVRLADLLVDGGVRGAGFLQQELLRPF